MRHGCLFFSLPVLRGCRLEKGHNVPVLCSHSLKKKKKSASNLTEREWGLAWNCHLAKGRQEGLFFLIGDIGGANNGEVADLIASKIRLITLLQLPQLYENLAERKRSHKLGRGIPDHLQKCRAWEGRTGGWGTWKPCWQKASIKERAYRKPWLALVGVRATVT